jgi:hypothetical protein
MNAIPIKKSLWKRFLNFVEDQRSTAGQYMNKLLTDIDMYHLYQCAKCKKWLEKPLQEHGCEKEKTKKS